MQKKIVKVKGSVEYDKLKCLLVAAHLLGQEMGLRGFTYSHPDCINQRENLISFIFQGNVYKKDENTANI